jgi:hypothetical protein
MLWATLILLLRRYRKTHPQGYAVALAQVVFVVRLVVLLLLAMGCTLHAHTQTKNLSYSIKQNGKVVGTLHVKEAAVKGKVSYQVRSHVQTRFLIQFDIKAVEEAHFENSILVASSIRRTMNGSEKKDQSILLQGNRYLVTNSGKKEVLSIYPIRHTLLSLYLYEPLHYTEIFSDVFQRLLPVQKVAPHHYKVHFPDGAHNEFFYKHGVCTKIIIHNTLYKAVIELKV